MRYKNLKRSKSKFTKASNYQSIPSRHKFHGVKEMTKKRSASAGEAGAGGHKHKDESTEVSAQAVEEDINALRDRLKEKECEAQEYVSMLYGCRPTLRIDNKWPSK